MDYLWRDFFSQYVAVYFVPFGGTSFECLKGTRSFLFSLEFARTQLLLSMDSSWKEKDEDERKEKEGDLV